MPFLIETGTVDIGTAYKPNRRFKAGIELARQFGKAAAFDFSRYACLEFGVGMSIIGYSPQSTTRTSLYSSVAGIVNKQLVFSIPYDAKTPLQFKKAPSNRGLRQFYFIAQLFDIQFKKAPSNRGLRPKCSIYFSVNL